MTNFHWTNCLDKKKTDDPGQKKIGLIKKLQEVHPPKTNMEPKNCWLVAVSRFPFGGIFRFHVHFPGSINKIQNVWWIDNLRHILAGHKSIWVIIRTRGQRCSNIFKKSHLCFEALAINKCHPATFDSSADRVNCNRINEILLML